MKTIFNLSYLAIAFELILGIVTAETLAIGICGFILLFVMYILYIYAIYNIFE